MLLFKKIHQFHMICKSDSPGQQYWE